jgi:hypothetical protein
LHLQRFLASLRGFEPPAYRLGGGRSIQLSYRDIKIENIIHRYYIEFGKKSQDLEKRKRKQRKSKETKDGKNKKYNKVFQKFIQ